MMKLVLILLIAVFLPGPMWGQMEIEWARSIKGVGGCSTIPNIYGIDVDQFGNPWILQGRLIPATCSSEVKLRKFDPTGFPVADYIIDTIVYARTYDEPAQLQFTPDGNIFICLMAYKEAMIYKYNDSGVRLWHWGHQVSNAQNAVIGFRKIEYDDSSNIYLSTDINQNGVTYELYRHFSKFSASGVLLWDTIPSTTQNPSWPPTVTLDGQGGVFVTSGNSVGYVSLIDQAGVPQWFLSSRRAVDAALDAHGNLVQAIIPITNGTHYMLQKIDRNANLKWEVDVTLATGITPVQKVLTDAQSSIYVSGPQGNDVRVAKLDSAGNLVWNFLYQPQPNGMEVPIDLKFFAGELFLRGEKKNTSSNWSLPDTVFLVKISPGGTLADEVSYLRPFVWNQSAGNYMRSSLFGDIYLSSFTAYSGSEVVKICGEACIQNVSGIVFLDQDSTCVLDTAKPSLSYQLVSFGPGGLYTVTDSSGNYGFRIDSGTVSYDLIYPTGFTNSCNTGPYTVTVSPSSFIHDSLNIGLVPPSSHNLSTLIASTPPRPGFYQRATIYYANHGGEVNGSILELVLDPNAILVQTDPIQSQVSGDTVRWSLGTLAPFEFGIISVLSRLPATVPLSVPYKHKVCIWPMQGDSDPLDNCDSTFALVAGSWDPNDKNADPHGEGIDGNFVLDETPFFSYQIRFQNTGTDTAFNVVVLDTIDYNLNLSSFSMGPASHPYRLKIRDGRILEWTFPNILLPDSGTNELMSNGYIKYRMSPRQNLQIGEQIRNKAAIYFDFNLPVITNEVVNTVHLLTKSEEEYLLVQGITLYPNPTQDNIHIRISSPLKEGLLFQVYDLQGRSMFNSVIPQGNTSAEFSLSGLVSGIYFVKFESSGKTWLKKLILW